MASVISIVGCRKLLSSADSSFQLTIESLEVFKGEFLGFVGKSGSGKSTLLDLLSLASVPDQLESYVLTLDDRSLELRESILSNNDRVMSRVRLKHFGYVLQWGGLVDCLSVEENINLIPNALGIEPQVPDSTLVRALEMGPEFTKPIRSLSGGQRQRVSILRALATNAEVVVADEPTAAIDENMAEIVIQQFRSLAKDTGATVLLVSHDLDLVDQYCDRVIELHPETKTKGQVETRVVA